MLKASEDVGSAQDATLSRQMGPLAPRLVRAGSCAMCNCGLVQHCTAQLQLFPEEACPGHQGPVSHTRKLWSQAGRTEVPWS